MISTRLFAVQLHPQDDVAIARQQLSEGMPVAEGVFVRGLIPAGHKVALHLIRAGEPVRRYGQIIGTAIRDVRAGDHVHTHNLAMTHTATDYAFASDAKHPGVSDDRATFMGIVRTDGGVATRNYIGVLTTVNCAATAARGIADHFRRDIHPQELEPFPHVDGVIALTHTLGCATNSEGEELALLRRTLGGYARHPNFAAVLVVGLGCETNQAEDIFAHEGLASSAQMKVMTIQATGGTAKTVAMGVDEIRRMLRAANDVTRRIADASHLIVGLQCGGSDGYSGITANPALGFAVDRLIANGGTAILSETPEMYGAEHLLTRRAVSREVGEKLIDRVRWWEEYCLRMNST